MIAVQLIFNYIFYKLARVLDLMECCAREPEFEGSALGILYTNARMSYNFSWRGVILHRRSLENLIKYELQVKSKTANGYAILLLIIGGDHGEWKNIKLAILRSQENNKARQAWRVAIATSPFTSWKSTRHHDVWCLKRLQLNSIYISTSTSQVGNFQWAYFSLV